MNVSDEAVNRAARAICRSGKFETGEGTCALRCLETLGSARGQPSGCPHAIRVHGAFARTILEAAQ